MMSSIKSINCVVVSTIDDAGYWVIRAKLTDGRALYKGIGAGWNLSKASKEATIDGAPKAGQSADVLELDATTDYPPKSYWQPLPLGLNCRTI